MALIAIYGLFVRALMLMGVPVPLVVTFAASLTAAGLAQVTLFHGNRPRLASIALGAAAAPICLGVRVCGLGGGDAHRCWLGA